MGEHRHKFATRETVTRLEIRETNEHYRKLRETLLDLAELCGIDRVELLIGRGPATIESDDSARDSQ